MKLISQIKKIRNKVSGQISFNENLSKHSWFNLGGPAKVIFRPKNLSELSTFLKSIPYLPKHLQTIPNHPKTFLNSWWGGGGVHLSPVRVHPCKGPPLWTGKHHFHGLVSSVLDQTWKVDWSRCVLSFGSGLGVGWWLVNGWGWGFYGTVDPKIAKKWLITKK